MAEEVWFVVARGPGGRDSPSVIMGSLPGSLTRKIPKDRAGNPMEKPPVVYSLRLDKLPDDERRRWITDTGEPAVSVSMMYRTYCKLRDRGELPALTG